MLSRSFLLLEYRIVWRRADLLLTILFWIQLFILKGFHFLTIVSRGCTPFAKNDLRYFRCILVTENLSCWCCLRTESSFSKAEDLASQIGCYWHDGPKLDWWQSPCDRHPPSSIPISRTKSLMDYQRGDLHDYRQYIHYQSLSIRSDQNVPEAKKHEAFQSAESYVQILPGQSTRKVHKSLL